MVKITNGINVFDVPRGAAKAYEASGYHVIVDSEADKS